MPRVNKGHDPIELTEAARREDLPRWDGIDTTMNVLAIDPGDVHVGMAEFEDGRCVRAWEATPAECLVAVQESMISGWLDGGALVVESFELYPWKAQEQAFSQLETSQLIGALKLLHVSQGTMYLLHPEPPAWIWYQQKATIKKPSFAQLQARKIVLLSSKVPGQHAKDAEAHGYHFLSNKPTERKSNIAS